MTAYLSLITDAAQTHADELATGGARYRLSQRRLADTGRANQAQNRRLQAVDALLHGKILDDPFLDLFQTPVIGVEDLSSRRKILADSRPFAPRKTDQRLDEIAHHCRFGRHRRHQLELSEFRLRLGKPFLAHPAVLTFLSSSSRSAPSSPSPSSFWIALTCSLR
jgi:hypothetical protein